ncbi:hypothetical protein Ancab_014657 [Ancistrocladus abbreviatus]
MASNCARNPLMIEGLSSLESVETQMTNSANLQSQKIQPSMVAMYRENDCGRMEDGRPSNDKATKDGIMGLDDGRASRYQRRLKGVSRISAQDSMMSMHYGKSVYMATGIQNSLSEDVG